MAPYGACEVAQSTARSNAQFEAERFRKEFRRKKKQCRKCFRRKKKHARKCFRRKKKHARAVIANVSAFKARSSSDFERAAASKEKEACSSIYFERSVASKAKEACSSIDFERSVAFRRSSGYGARLSSDFERIMRKHRACAVFSSAVDRLFENKAQAQCFRIMRSKSLLKRAA